MQKEEFRLFLSNSSPTFVNNTSTKFVAPLCYPIDCTEGKWVVALSDIALDKYQNDDEKEKRKGQPLLIYSNICESKLSGSNVSQLLATTFVNIHEKDAPLIVVAMKRPFYTPVVKERIGFIEFTLCTEDGKEFPISKDAKVYLTIHLKKLWM